MRDVHPSTKKCQALTSWKDLSVDWSCFFWMRWYKLQQVLSCKQFVDFFLDRWEVFVLHPSQKKHDSCQALLNFIECWLIIFCLNEVIQAATRSSAISNSVTFFLTDERCSTNGSLFIPSQKNPDNCLALFAFIEWCTDHVLFERAFTSYNQVFSCKQFGDLFLDRWGMFVPLLHQKM